MNDQDNNAAPAAPASNAEAQLDRLERVMDGYEDHPGICAPAPAAQAVRAYAMYRTRPDENDGEEFFFYAMWHPDTIPQEGERLVKGWFVPDATPAPAAQATVIDATLDQMRAAALSADETEAAYQRGFNAGYLERGLDDADRPAPAAQADGVRWDLFPSWLIDHCEGDTITEEGLQHALADMLKAYPAQQSATPADAASEADKGDELEPVHGDVLPPIGSRVFIHLASVDAWRECTVVGYYVWPSFTSQSEYRVNVRVRMDDGTLNARMLCDIQRERQQGAGDA